MFLWTSQIESARADEDFNRANAGQFFVSAIAALPIAVAIRILLVE